MSDPAWRKSTRSDQTNCVEVALLPHATLVRNSKTPHGAHLAITAKAWSGFLGALHTDRYTRP